MNEYYVLVFIPAYNCIESITDTINSVLKQDFNKDRLKILVMDNGSNDGTYEEVIRLTKLHKEIMSVYRLPNPTKFTRMLKKAAELVSYSWNIRYTTILLPGNTLKENYISYCSRLMDVMRDFNGNMLISEVDILEEDGETHQQIPLYTDKCILKDQLHKMEFFTTDICHRVQTFYRGFPVRINEALNALVDIVTDYDSWMSKGFFNDVECIYINEVLGTCKKRVSIDQTEELINKMTAVKKRYLYIESAINYDTRENELELRDVMNIYRRLSLLALKYAVGKIQINDIIEAKRLYKLAQVIYPEIVNENEFELLRDYFDHKTLKEQLFKINYKKSSKKPPFGSLVFEF